MVAFAVDAAFLTARVFCEEWNFFCLISTGLIDCRWTNFERDGGGRGWLGGGLLCGVREICERAVAFDFILFFVPLLCWLIGVVLS